MRQLNISANQIIDPADVVRKIEISDLGKVSFRSQGVHLEQTLLVLLFHLQFNQH